MRGTEQITGDGRIRCAGKCWAMAPVLLFMITCFLLANVASADTLHIVLGGLNKPLLDKISSRVESLDVSSQTRLSARRLQQTVVKAEREAVLALYPYGYYHAEVTGTLTSIGEDAWQLDLEVNPGPPVIITSASVEVVGDGAGIAPLQRWKRRWPLVGGKVLDQTVWDSQKQAALELAEANGYLGADFTQHTIEADLDQNTATIVLELQTGPQAVMGEVTFVQDVLDPGILELLPRFTPGQAYDSWLLEKFRLDIWRTGYFKDVEIVEERRLEETPPKVNLVVKAENRPPNTYQGSLGYGSDTDIRTQFLWTRHILSRRGDSLETGVGWRQRTNEYTFKSNYRLPRRTRDREFWIAEAFLRREEQDFEIKPYDDEPDAFKLTRGHVTDYAVKAGNLVVRDLERGYQQIFETWYAQYLLENNTFALSDFATNQPAAETYEATLDPFEINTQTISLGVNWDWPVIRGHGFRTRGHHERAWIFTSNEIWGSDQDFTQVYLSSNWTKLLDSKWKLLLRGEVGYTNADTRDAVVEVNGENLNLSVTELPNLYRFKNGGSRTVRGYSFESLSNNGVGSNNVLTVSAEIEWSFRQNWSVAGFFDMGNAFNEWNETDLKKGAGVGLRWYSLAGPIRLDFAQALSYDGHPWEIHFTIGTPLL